MMIGSEEGSDGGQHVEGMDQGGPNALPGAQRGD